MQHSYLYSWWEIQNIWQITSFTRNMTLEVLTLKLNSKVSGLVKLLWYDVLYKTFHSNVDGTENPQVSVVSLTSDSTWNTLKISQQFDYTTISNVTFQHASYLIWMPMVLPTLHFWPDYILWLFWLTRWAQQRADGLLFVQLHHLLPAKSCIKHQLIHIWHTYL